MKTTDDYWYRVAFPASLRSSSGRPEWARHSEACYVLLPANITVWNAETLWRTYVQLTDADVAFRIQRSEFDPQ